MSTREALQPEFDGSDLCRRPGVLPALRPAGEHGVSLKQALLVAMGDQGIYGCQKILLQPRQQLLNLRSIAARDDKTPLRLLQGVLIVAFTHGDLCHLAPAIGEALQALALVL